MVIQIFCITDKETALRCAEIGVDHIGMRVNQTTSSPIELDYKQGRVIVDALKGKAKSVVISASSNIDEIYDLALSLKPDIIQTLADFDTLKLNDRAKLRVKLNLLGIKITNGLPLIDQSSIELAQELASYTDIIMVETFIANQKEMGATGVVNDWNLAAKLVESVNVPVIMSGGLGPENVKECINKVKPWGVDSMTKTDIVGSNHMQKDIELIQRFVQEAKTSRI